MPIPNNVVIFNYGKLQISGKIKEQTSKFLTLSTGRKFEMAKISNLKNFYNANGHGYYHD
jgi:hypothetical protein